MWPHFIGLLSRSWDSFLHAMGTTGLGFFTPVVVFALTVIVTFLVILFKQGKEAMKRHWKETAATTSGVTLAVMLIVYVPLFSWNLVSTVYNDHMDLLATKGQLETQNKGLKNKNTELESKNGQLDDENKSLRSKLTSRPRIEGGSSSTGPALPLPPPVQDIRIVSQDWIPSIKPQFKYELKAVVQTNVVIHPVSIVFLCDNEISEGYVTFAGEQAEMFIKVRNGVLVANNKAYLASFEQPSFTPEKNMVLQLFSNEPIKITSFEQTPFRFP